MNGLVLAAGFVWMGTMWATSTFLYAVFDYPSEEAAETRAVLVQARDGALAVMEMRGAYATQIKSVVLMESGAVCYSLNEKYRWGRTVSLAVRTEEPFDRIVTSDDRDILRLWKKDCVDGQVERDLTLDVKNAIETYLR
jgi:hypothetical protein